LRAREVACACLAAAVHVLFVVGAWRVQPEQIRGSDWQQARLPPLVASFYDAGLVPPDTSTLAASVSVESPLRAIELGPPPDLDAIASDSAGVARQTRSPADYEELARLQGMYRGQLFARLRRVLYELGPLEEGKDVPCTLNVIQRPDGSVVDVLTDLCAYSPRSLTLLRKAVAAASPLPLPPPGLATGTFLTVDISAYLATP
jgi:hypothetical protein